MRTKTRIVAVVLGAGLLGGLGALAQQTKPTTPPPAKESKTMEMHARGGFDVKITPAAEKVGDIARMTLDKRYHGDLEATAKGEMLSTGSADGSGVYVAIEQVQGTLGGRTGGFALHHTGIMTRGTPQLAISIAPDSGTGQLAGISGRLDIKIENGKHSYDLAYMLPKAP